MTARMLNVSGDIKPPHQRNRIRFTAPVIDCRGRQIRLEYFRCIIFHSFSLSVTTAMARQNTGLPTSSVEHEMSRSSLNISPRLVGITRSASSQGIAVSSSLSFIRCNNSLFVLVRFVRKSCIFQRPFRKYFHN